MATLSILNQIKESVNKRILYLPHAIRQMSRPDRMISSADVREIIKYGEIIEDYPMDPRGHSCLLLGYDNKNRPIHVVCSPKEDYLAIITAYIPGLEEWKKGYKEKKKL
ncbi:MAG: DUF4258 domain-containing protein [bacterium]